MTSCPFCNIRMYSIIDENYPNLETYLCYECGFHVDTILMEQKALYQQYQRLFMHSNGVLVPKKMPPTKMNNQNKHPDNEQQLTLSSVYSLVVAFGCLFLVGMFGKGWKAG